MKGRLLLSLSVVALLVFILAGACSKPAPTPTPATTPTAKPTAKPAPATTPSAKPTAKPTTAPAKVEVEFRIGTTGGTSYVAGFAASELINKYSTWLRATNVEVSGSTAVVAYMQERPEKKANILFWANAIGKHQANIADPPLKSPYPGYRFLVRMAEQSNVLVTLDPKIKTPVDFAGKRLGMFTKGITIERALTFILDKGYGVWDKVKPSYTHFTASANALLDGTLDAALEGTTIVSPAGDWEPVEGLQALMTQKEAYFIPLDKTLVAKASKESGWPILVNSPKPKDIGKTKAQKMDGLAVYLGLGCDASMSDDVATEIVRILYEHASELGNYHASMKGVTKDNISAWDVNKADFHPAAVKFYESKGSKIGFDGLPK